MMGLGNGTWNNTGSGFESNNVLLGYGGNYLSLNTNYSNGGIGGMYIDIPGVNLTGSISSWGQQIQNHANSFLGDWYGPGGQANWFFGAAATFSSIKGGLNAERMYGEGIRRGISANYQLTGRNLSQFGKMASTEASMPISSLAKWGGIAGQASFFAGVAMDGIAVANGEISPNKFYLNTGMGAYGTWVNPAAGILYFGIDAFYPGGWDGAMKDTELRQAKFDRIINANSGMPRQYIFPYGSQKF
ncbi:MAG: hypothetical protein E2600_06005 [Chryseobacterium sp.]|nr:hypothetical protein [Chryseobacterium sp.]